MKKGNLLLNKKQNPNYVTKNFTSSQKFNQINNKFKIQILNTCII